MTDLMSLARRSGLLHDKIGEKVPDMALKQVEKFHSGGLYALFPLCFYSMNWKSGIF